MISTPTILRVPFCLRQNGYFTSGWIHQARAVQSSLLFPRSLSQEALLDRCPRLSRFWIPTGGITPTAKDDSHAKLIRAGFLRQAHPGIFHLLPLGRRVLNKLEILIDRHMYGLGASKLELSSISSEDLWSKSGRLQSAGTELFRFKDRKDVPYVLSPTHEEEITSLVANTVKSYKELPVLLYQTTRKYRDELRPRQGLLRSREFVMKDLYTFDISTSAALSTYYRVRDAYVKLFEELKLPFIVAEADSGDMGGSLSHEFHFPTSKGEDHVVSCSHCRYVANEELAEGRQQSHDNEACVQVSDGNEQPTKHLKVWRSVSKDRLTLINVWYSSSTPAAASVITSNSNSELNVHAIKAVFPETDVSVENPIRFWNNNAHTGETRTRATKVVNLIDGRLSPGVIASLQGPLPPLSLVPETSDLPSDIRQEFIIQNPSSGLPLNVLRIKSGDPCSRCSDGTLLVQKAIEMGHTFYLGSRYSDPMGALIVAPKDVQDSKQSSNSQRPDPTRSFDQRVPFQMGCHGIGLTRVIGAVADALADEKGLNWPRVIAPFEGVVIPTPGLEDAAQDVFKILSSRDHSEAADVLTDLVIDDRAHSFPWKMQDADLVGYPIIIVVGRKWKARRMCEVQCRRLDIKEDVAIPDLQVFIRSLLIQL